MADASPAFEPPPRVAGEESTAGPVRGEVQPPAAEAGLAERLRILSAKDQRTYVRGACAIAIKEEAKVMKDLQNAIYLLASANGHCQITSEADPQWFTLDVQDSHSRRIAILCEVLSKIESQPIAAPADLEAADGIKGRALGAYAQTALATQRATNDLQKNERTRALAAQAGAATNRIAEQGKAAAAQTAALAGQGKAAAAVASSSLTKMLSRGFGTNTAASEPGGLAPPGEPAGDTSPAAPPLHEAYDGAGITGES